MALYKDKTKVRESEDAVFDKVFNPGDAPPHRGIYRCTGCDHEICVESTTGKLPPQNHTQHPNGPAKWKLLIYAEWKAS